MSLKPVIFSNAHCCIRVMIPVSCMRNTWSPLHVFPHRSTLVDRLGSHAPSTPRFVGGPLDLEHKHFITILMCHFFAKRNK